MTVLGEPWEMLATTSGGNYEEEGNRSLRIGMCRQNAKRLGSARITGSVFQHLGPVPVDPLGVEFVGQASVLCEDLAAGR